MHGIVVLAALAATAALPPATTAAPSHPIAAIGDSLTVAWGAGALASGANVRGGARNASWATGGNPAVSSYLFRLGRQVPVRGINLAHFGASIVDRDRGWVAQAARIPAGTEYVLVGGGTADVCAKRVGQASDMVSVTAFQNAARKALHVIRRRLPDARILVLSIPNWPALVGASELAHRPMPTGACPLLLSDTSTPATKMVVAARLRGYNAALGAICAGLGDACRFDRFVVYRLRFRPAELSTVDRLHLSIRGQAKLAAAAWAIGRPPWEIGSTTAPCLSRVCVSVEATIRVDLPALVRVSVVDAETRKPVLLLPGSSVGAAVSGRRRGGLTGDGDGPTRLRLRIAAVSSPRRYVIVVRALAPAGARTLQIPFRA